jgi:PAS domain S-box-containing protein
MAQGESQILLAMIKIEPAPEELQAELAKLRERVRQLEAEAKSRQDIEDQLNRFFTTLNDMFCVAGTDGTFKRLSPAWKNLLGFSLEELLDKPFLDFIHPDDHRMTLAAFEKFRTTYDVDLLEARCRTKSGIYKWLQWRPIGVLDEQYIYAMAMDITSRKLAEEAMRKSDSNLRAILENTRQSFVLLNHEGRIRSFNTIAADIIQNMTGKRLQEAAFYRDFVTPEDILFYEANFAAAMNGQTVRNETQIKLPDNSLGWIETVYNPVVDDAGKISGVVIGTVNVTKRKQAELVVQQSEEKYRKLMEAANDAIFVTDEQTGLIIDANKKAEELIGRTGDELIGMYHRELYSAEDADQYEIFFKSNLQPSAIGSPQIYVQHSDGRKIPVEVSTSRVDVGNRTILQGVFRDIRERQQAELEKERLTEQLIRSQKMEAIGTLANGIAHDFNNIMGVVLMATNLLQQKTKEPTLQKHLKTVQEAVDRGAAIARQLLVFSRTAKMKMQPIEVAGIVKQVTRMLEHSLSKNISITTSTLSKDDVVLGDSNQLYQTFLNLGINAGDAMPNGGTLNFTVSSERGKGLAEKSEQDVPERFVVITVTDSGTGIPKDVQDRIFDPFFTTKEVGKGTGLGLAIVHGIIKSHKGWIDVQSRLGQGTTFTIHLPAVNQQVSKPEPLVAVPSCGSGTILLVDDEMALRVGLAEGLKELGFSVIEARDGAEGLEAYTKRQSEIDLVVTDLGMPAMNGDEMFRSIKDINRKAKVIMMTGYIMGERQSTLLEQGMYEIIQKPFQMSRMLQIIRDAVQVK